MKAIKFQDFKKYGCVKCGCNYAYSDGYHFGTEAAVVCAECGTKFIILNDKTKIASIGYHKKSFDGLIIPKKDIATKESILQFISEIDFSDPIIQKKLQEGIGIEKDDFVYVLVGPHPREGIPAHDLVVPDIRPEGGKGDYCTPRGVGYDLACFVKSKQAGERITAMINRVVQDYEEKPFVCRLDYREDEPLWIQVKIAYQNRLRALYLEKLLEENNHIITETIIRTACNEKMENLVESFHNPNKKIKEKK